MKTVIRTFTVAIAVLLFATSLRAADECTALIPKEGPYNVFRSWSSTDFQLMIDDYVYRQNWTTHSEAINSGLSIGTIVYGVPLQIGGTFDKTKVTEWKQQYEHRKKLDYVLKNREVFEKLIVDKTLVTEVTNCIIRTHSVFGLSTRLIPNGDCSFTFVASYLSDREGIPQPKVTSLKVNGGSCDQWPSSQKIPPNGFGVNCRRFGRNALSVSINSATGTKTETVEALPLVSDNPPSKPEFGWENTKKETKSVSVGRTNWVFEKICSEDQGCFSFNFQVDGKITNVDWGACSGESCGWIHPCPDGGKCDGHTTPFEKVHDNLWRAWMLSNSAAPSVVPFTIHYLAPEEVCVRNCYDRPYEQVFSEWERERQRTCPSTVLPFSK